MTSISCENPDKYGKLVKFGLAQNGMDDLQSKWQISRFAKFSQSGIEFQALAKSVIPEEVAKLGGLRFALTQSASWL